MVSLSGRVWVSMWMTMSGRPREHDGRRRGRWTPGGRLLVAVLSVAGHVLAILTLALARTDAPQLQEPEPISVALVEPPPPPPLPIPAPVKAAAVAPPAPSPARLASVVARPRSILRPTLRPPPEVEPLAASPVPGAALTAELGEAELAGATTAGSGSGSGGGGSCDMARLLQNALRRNPRFQAAVAGAHPDAVAAGKAVLVWNGDWLRSPSQAGKGFAGVREVIILEVAFAPVACRTAPVHGLILLSLNDAPGAARLALGAREWRWSDLLFAR